VSAGLSHPSGRSAPAPRRRDVTRDVPGRGAVYAGYAVVATAAVGVAAGVSPWAGAAALVAAALGAAAIQWPAAAALSLVAIAPAVSGLKRGLPVPGFRLSELLIAGGATLILVAADRRRTVRWRAFDWLALAYVIATAVLGSADLIGRGEGFSADSLGTLAGPLQFFLLYRAVIVALPTAEDRRRALAVILVASVPVAVLALAQQFDVAGVRSLMVHATGTDIYLQQIQNGETPRATGPFPHWHQLGGYLLLVTLVGVGLLLAGSGRVMRRRWLIAIVALDAAALVQTVTIAAVFGAVGGALLLGYWLHRLRPVIWGIVVAGVLAAVVAGPVIEQRFEQQWVKTPGSEGSALVPSTIDFRWQVWTEQYFPVLQGRWLTGYGPNPPPTPFQYADSLYITLILRGGLVLLAVYAAMTVALWAMSRGAIADPDPERRVVAAVVAATVLLLVVIHIIEPYFLDSGAPHVLWALTGLLAAGAVYPRRPSLRT
jgi:hypothetical protein